MTMSGAAAAEEKVAPLVGNNMLAAPILEVIEDEAESCISPSVARRKRMQQAFNNAEVEDGEDDCIG